MMGFQRNASETENNIIILFCTKPQVSWPYWEENRANSEVLPPTTVLHIARLTCNYFFIDIIMRSIAAIVDFSRYLTECHRNQKRNRDLLVTG